MARTAPVAVWSYLVIATLLEAALVTNLSSLGVLIVDAIVLLLAAGEIFSIGFVYMHLKWEPRSLVGVAVISVFFAVLAVSLSLASLGH